jgi:hypothetical protein
MFKKLACCLAVLFLTATFAFAEPKAVIVGRTEAKTNESVWFKTTGSVGKTFKFKILPTDADSAFMVLPVYGGLDTNRNPIVQYWAHFSSDKAGKYYIIFEAVEDNESDIAVLTLNYGAVTPPIPTPDPAPVIPTPSSDIINIVMPISGLIKGNDALVDGAELSKFYKELADTVQRDGTANKWIKTTDNVRELNIQAGTLMFAQTNMKGKYSGLGEAIDKALSSKVGLEVVELTDTKRKDVVDILNGISWACGKATVKGK